MNHVDIRKTLAASLYDVLAHSGRLPKKPRPYQAETLTKIADWLSDSSGTRRSYVQHATGLGKTITFATAVRAARDLRSLIVVPSRPLLVQTARTVVKYTNGIIGHLSSVGNIANHDGEIIAVRGLDHSSVVIVTDASFNKFAQQILQDFDPHLILRDECHWGYSDEDIQTLNLFEEAVIVGFSATPDFLTNKARGGYTPVTLDNGQVLYGPRDKFADTHFQTCLDRRSLRWGIEEGWLAPLAWGLIDFEKISLKDVPIVNGEHGPDYDKSKLQAMLETHWSVMCETIRRLYENGEIGLHERQVYAVCPSVKAAKELSNTIASLGLSTACVTGDTPSTERDILFEAYRDKEIRFMSSVRVLREGWDDPNAEVCMMLTPTVSYPYYVQPIGRCVRLPEDGSPKTSLVLDAHFQGKTFSPLSAPALFAPPGSEVPIGGILIERRGGCGGIRGTSEEAPILPKQANPRVIIVDNYDFTAQGIFADIDGSAKINGVIIGTLPFLEKTLGIPTPTLRGRIHKKGVSAIQGIGRNGQPSTFYNLDEVRNACANLLTKDTLRSDTEGVLQTKEGKRMTVSALSLLLSVSEPSLQKKLDAANCKFVEGRNTRNTLGRYYLIGDAKKVCADLLADYPRATNSNGLIKINGVIFGDPTNLAKMIGVSHPTVRARVAKHECRKQMCRDLLGRPIMFYALSDVKRLCKDLVDKKRPKVGKNTLHLRGKECTTVKKFARKRGISSKCVYNRLKAANIKGDEQRASSNGIAARYYPIQTLERLCADIINNKNKADSDGVFRNKEGEWISGNNLVTNLSTSWHTLQVVIKKYACRTISALSKSGGPATYYHSEDVKKAYLQHRARNAKKNQRR